QVPFDADTPMEVLAKHAHEPPPPPRSLNPDLSAEVVDVLLHALMKEPAARYQSAGQMADALEYAATQLERRQARSQTTTWYKAGLQAFEGVHWNQAVEQFSRIVALDPDYEDAADLLVIAQETQQRARTEAREQIEQVRLRRQSTIKEIPTPAAPAAPPA